MKEPKLRFNKFKDQWIKTNIEDISIINPKSLIPSKFIYVDLDGVSGTKLNNYKILNKKDAPSRAQRVAKIGDIFYQSVRPYQKNNLYFNVRNNQYYYVFSSGYMQIRVSHCYGYFLFSEFQTNKFVYNVLLNCTGTSYPAINSSNFKSLNIYIPIDTIEQQQIGDFFATLDHLIQLQQEKVTLLKRLKRAYLQRLFHNSKTNKIKLSNLCSIKTGNKNAKDDVPNGRYPFFDRSTEIKHLNTYDYNEETIIYAGEGEKFLPRYYNGKYSLHQRAYSLYNFKTDIVNVIYLYEFLLTQSHRFIRYAVGTTVKSLRMDCFKHVYVPIISLKNQKVIGKFLLQNSKIINLCVQNIHYLRKLKKAYLQKMFC